MTKLLLLATLFLPACTSTYASPLPPLHVPPLRVAPPDPSPGPARTRAMLEALLARFDETPPGSARDTLADEIDAVAGQRYATVSRLFWHTDLASARREARATGKPILSLRMLGRLDEDLSCANSRLFRTTLYPDATVASLLRERFVLHWSSERPVPRVTIDVGDGRRIETTTTGNSAHYVLDDEGRVLDVLPGMYAPPAFVAELTRSLALFDDLGRIAPAERPTRIARYHADAAARIDAVWPALAGTAYLPGAVALASQEQITGALARAQRATVSKAYIEVPQLAHIGLDAGSVPEDDAAWATIGQRLWRLGLDAPDPANASPASDGAILLTGMAVAARPAPTRPIAPAADRPRILDATTRGLVSAVHNAGPVTADREALERMIARLEQHLVADSAHNQLVLRRSIHAQLATGARDFDPLNAWIYGEVFHTPASDPWLGLLPRTDFTGLPGDGARSAITARR